MRTLCPRQCLLLTLVPLQVGPTGSALDIQLPSGSPHVVLISLLHMLRDLREQYANMLVPQTVIKVVLTLGVQVRVCARELESVPTASLGYACPASTAL